jgi:hypothetical protein
MLKKLRLRAENFSESRMIIASTKNDGIMEYEVNFERGKG